MFARNFSAAPLTFKDRVARFFGYESKGQQRLAALTAEFNRNPDLRARRFMWLAMLLSQLTNVTSLGAPILAAGFAASAVALFIREAPRNFAWRSVLLLLTLAAGVFVFLSYGKLIGRDAGIALLFIFGPLKLIEARTSRDYMVVWGLGLVLYVASFFENLGLGAALTLPVIVVMYIAALRLFDSRADDADAPNIVAHIKQSTVHMLMGIPLAAMLFILFPRAAAPLWGMRDSTTARTGLSEEMQPGEIAQLIQSRETAFRVEFEGTRRPARADLYWRGPVLRQLVDNRWTATDIGAKGELIEIVPEQIARESLTYKVTVERLDTRWLPVLDLPTAYPNGQGLDRTVFLSDAQQVGLRRIPNGPIQYQVQSIPRASYPTSAEKVLNIELSTGNPRNNPKSVALGKSLREQYPDPRARVQALLAFFNREQFFYTLNPPLYNQDRSRSIDKFLFEDRRGFCEHYAGAAVVVLRASGIPARIVTGYQGGEWHPNGYMIVRQSDAHAWIEVWIDGQWSRVDPTAAVAPNRVELGITAALPETEALMINTRRWFETERLAAVWENLTFSYTKWVIGFDRERQRELMRDLGLGNMNPIAAIGWMLIAVSLSGAVVALSWWLAKRRSEKKLDKNVQLWHTLRKRLIKAGLPIAPHETVKSALARAAARWPEHAAAFDTFANHYDQNRFAKPSSANGPANKRANDAALNSALRALPSLRELREQRRVQRETAKSAA